MRTSHLTFGQLLKLKHPVTLMRVTQAYHSALLRRWEAGCNGEFMVLKAERMFPTVAARYQKLLAWLQGQELRTLLREAASSQRPLRIPGAKTVLVAIRLGVLPQAKLEAISRATCIQALCHQAGLPCWWEVVEYPWAKMLTVFTETDETGVSNLCWRMGIPFNTLRVLCQNLEVSADAVFYWVPEELRAANVMVNPVVFPMNTPNCEEIAQELLGVL